MKTPQRNQYSGTYMGLLVFKYTLHMLTRKEKKILSDWRNLPGNEKFFKDLVNPENRKKRMQEMEDKKILIWKKTKQKLPYLPDLPIKNYLNEADI
jgi:hypothetical protein